MLDCNCMIGLHNLGHNHLNTVDCVDYLISLISEVVESCYYKLNSMSSHLPHSLQVFLAVHTMCTVTEVINGLDNRTIPV